MAITRTSSTRSSSPASHLSRRDRIRGGQMSAEVQVRDSRGQFAGRRDDSRRSRSRNSNASMRSARGTRGRAGR